MFECSQQQQPQQLQHQNQPHQLKCLQNKQPLPKKKLYRCQVCSASFDSRLDCLDHIQRDHNQQQPTSTTEVNLLIIYKIHVWLKLLFLGTGNQCYFGRKRVSIPTTQYTKFYWESAGCDQEWGCKSFRQQQMCYGQRHWHVVKGQ